jgi:hypothetical protein
MSNKDYRIQAILLEVQNLEEMGGVEGLEEYVEILETVRADIDKRISAAKDRIADGEVY